MAAACTVIPPGKNSLLAAVDQHSGQRVMSCYQCAKCSAGCPMASSSDVGPHQVMRAVQMGIRDTALNNEMIWMCLSCQTCSVRCPREIDVAAVMETLRHMALVEGPQGARDIRVFHRAFLEVIKRQGRLYELGLGALFNGLSGRPLTNIGLMPRMLAKRKLGLLPERAKSTADVAAIFERVARIERRELRGEATHDG